MSCKCRNFANVYCKECESDAHVFQEEADEPGSHQMTDRLLKRATDVGLVDCYPSCWLTRDGGQSVCVLTSDTGQMVRGVGVDHDAARADALRLAGERFGR